MFVHKKTMGVLSWIYSGIPATPRTNGCRRAKKTDIPDFDENEWWYVKDDSALGRYIAMIYPYMRPIEDADGVLVAVVADKRITDEYMDDVD